MVWIFVLSSAVLLLVSGKLKRCLFSYKVLYSHKFLECFNYLLSFFLLTKASPIKEKDDHKEIHGLNHQNLVLTIDSKQNQPNPKHDTLEMSERRSLTDRRSKDIFDTKSRSKKMTKNNLMHNNVLQNSEGKFVREPLLALIPIRNRRLWRRRNFQVYNTIPDSSYHFDSYVIDPMYYFWGIGK